MHDSHFLDWLQTPTADGLDDLKTPDVKVEMHTDFSFLSTPCPSSPVTTTTSLSTPLCRRRSSKSSSPRNHRIRPYPEPSTMSGNPYGWTARGNPRSPERRSSDGDQSVYGVHSYTPMYASRSTRSSPSGLVSPSIPRADAYSAGINAMEWTAQSHQPSNSAVASQPPVFPSGGDMQYPGTSSTGLYPEEYTSSGSVTPFPNSPFRDTFGTFVDAPNASGQFPSSSPNVDEITQLKRRIAELQSESRRDKERIHSLETRLTSGAPSSPSPTFHASWRARTDARTRLYCSLNRAGNALCAWHDSRRERRIYPPRMAPPGYLNCGCTYEEALFEESLSRHGVGSYLPGETVRMDPALRNPLLKLLQERYNYRDGDFERDSQTGHWLPDEGHEKWVEQVNRGIGNPRRPRTDQSR